MKQLCLETGDMTAPQSTSSDVDSLRDSSKPPIASPGSKDLSPTVAGLVSLLDTALGCVKLQTRVGGVHGCSARIGVVRAGCMLPLLLAGACVHWRRHYSSVPSTYLKARPLSTGMEESTHGVMEIGLQSDIDDTRQRHGRGRSAAARAVT